MSIRGFRSSSANARKAGVGITVVSDGFDYVIENVLRNAGLDLVFKANHLEHVGGGHWRVTFPNSRSSCIALAGNCKCSFTEPHQKTMKIVVGDGRSDFCVSKHADLVFAKSKLLELCDSTGATHYPFESFFDVTDRLGVWLDDPSIRRPDSSARLTTNALTSHETLGGNKNKGIGMTADDRGTFVQGGRTGFLLLHGLSGTPVELRYIANGLTRAGHTVSCPQLAGHCGTLEDLTNTRWQDWHQTAEDALLKAPRALRPHHRRRPVDGCSTRAARRGREPQHR